MTRYKQNTEGLKKGNELFSLYVLFVCIQHFRFKMLMKDGHITGSIVIFHHNLSSVEFTPVLLVISKTLSYWI